MPFILIEIDKKTGEVTVTGKDFSGTQCATHIDPFLKKLGTIKKTKSHNQNAIVHQEIKT